MKVGGQEVTPCQEVLVLPRIDGDLVFIAQAVTDMEPFKKMVPEPKPPAVLKKGGFVADEESEEYQEMLKKFSELRFAYTCIKSLEPSEIEWERVQMDKPSTWPLWSEDLKDGGLSDNERNRVLVCILRANALDEGKLEKARADFLRGREANAKSSGPRIARPSTPSGEPASGSA